MVTQRSFVRDCTNPDRDRGNGSWRHWARDGVVGRSWDVRCDVWVLWYHARVMRGGVHVRRDKWVRAMRASALAHARATCTALNVLH